MIRLHFGASRNDAQSDTPAAIHRRHVLQGAGALGVSTLLPRAGLAQDSVVFGPERHGMSIFGDLKYADGFAHFDYVNPAAPKGGEMSL